MAGNRIIALDVLKLFAMWLVILGHCAQFLLSSHYLDEPLYVYIYSLHMPLFMLVSGLFASGSLCMPCGSFFLKKARQLLLPCIAWGVVMSLGNLVQPLLTGATVDKSIFSTWITNFWFLKSLFICYVLAYVGKHVLRNDIAFFVVTILLSQFITYYSVQWMYPAFAVGLWLSDKQDWLRSHAGKVALLAALVYGVLIFFWSGDSLCIGSIYTLDSGLTDGLLLLLHRLYRLLVGISGSLMLVALFLLPRLSSMPIFERIAPYGAYTLGIYIIHSIFFIIQQRFLQPWTCCDAIHPLLFNTIVAPMVSLVLLVVSVLLSRWIARMPYISFAFLGSSWPSRKR